MSAARGISAADAEISMRIGRWMRDDDRIVEIDGKVVADKA